MIDWSKTLKESPIDWLLEKTNPSVRYFTLRDILGIGENDRQVVAAKKAIPESGIIKRILQKQNAEGYWEEPDNPYHPKYRSSYWQLMILGQLGIDKCDGRVEKACEYIFQFQSDDGGFSSFTPKLALRELWYYFCYQQNLKRYEEWEYLSNEHVKRYVIEKAVKKLKKMDALLNYHGCLLQVHNSA